MCMCKTFAQQIIQYRTCSKKNWSNSSSKSYMFNLQAIFLSAFQGMSIASPACLVCVAKPAAPSIIAIILSCSIATSNGSGGNYPPLQKQNIDRHVLQIVDQVSLPPIYDGFPHLQLKYWQPPIMLIILQYYHISRVMDD